MEGPGSQGDRRDHGAGRAGERGWSPHTPAPKAAFDEASEAVTLPLLGTQILGISLLPDTARAATVGVDPQCGGVRYPSFIDSFPANRALVRDLRLSHVRRWT